MFWRYGGDYGSSNDKTSPIFYQEGKGEEHLMSVTAYDKAGNIVYESKYRLSFSYDTYLHNQVRKP